MKIQGVYKKAESRDYQKIFWNMSIDLIEEKITQKMINLVRFKDAN